MTESEAMGNGNWELGMGNWEWVISYYHQQPRSNK